MRITIAAKLVALGASGVLGVGVVGVVAYTSSGHQAQASRTMAGYSAALSKQWNADMLHDGLRATVMAALVAQTAAERDRFGTAEVTEQAATMLADLDAAAAGAPPAMRARYAAVRPEVAAYGLSATRLVEAAGHERLTARAMLPSFLEDFSRLEESLGGIDESMEAAVHAQQAASEAAASRSRSTILAVLALSAVVLVTLSALIIRAVISPVHRMRAVLADVAAGDLTLRVGSPGSAGSAGSPGDPRNADELGQLGQSIDATLGSVQDAFRVVSACADQVLCSAEELGTASGELSRAASQTSAKASESVSLAGQVAGSAREVAAGIDHVSVQTGEIADSASTASAVGRRAVDGAQVASASISRLGESSAQISGVAAMIRAIADQTRLLALNATIEAARAGDAGRGFAVVANEVKDLAQEVGRATEDISTRIASIQSEVLDAVQSIGVVTGVIGEINAHHGDIASAVQRQAGSSAQVAGGIQAAASEAGEIVGAVEVIAAAAVHTVDSARRTEVAAGGLAGTAEQLKSTLGSYRY